MPSSQSAAPPSLTQKVALDTASLLTSSLWSRGLSTVVGLVTARVLGPADFGLIKLIGFVPSLAKFGSFGFDSVAQREILHLRGAGASPEQEQHLKNVSFTADLIWAVLLALAVAACSLLYSQPEVRYGLWIAAGTLVLGQVGRLYAVVNSVNKRFALIAQAAAVGTTIEALAILLTISWGRIYSVLGGALLGGGAALLWYSRQSKLSFTWYVESKELKRQFRIALPLAGGTLAFGIFAWVERFQILGLFGKEQLGIYMLAAALYEVGILFLNTMLRASAAHLYEHLGRETGAQAGAGLVLKPSLALAVFFPLGGGLAWLLAPLALSRALPAYVTALGLLPWVVAMLTVRGVSAMAATAMNSARLNMQLPFTLMWLGATAVFAGGTWLGAYWGLGLTGAMVAKTMAFTAMALLTLGLTYSFFFASPSRLGGFILQVSCPLLGCLGLVRLLNYFWPVNNLTFTLLKSALFVIGYLPVMYFLERQTGVMMMLWKMVVAKFSMKMNEA